MSDLAGLRSTYVCNKSWVHTRIMESNRRRLHEARSDSLSLEIPHPSSIESHTRIARWMESTFPAEGIDRQVHRRCAHLYLRGRNLAPALHLAPTLIE